jgi:glutamine amidotransferase-like uncharacterized protein
MIGVYTHPTETMTRDLFPVLEHFGFSFRTIDRYELAKLRPGAVEVLLLPGGWYFFKEEKLIADGIRRFIEAGGGCIGICCGQINLCQLGIIEANLINQRILGPCIIEVVKEEHPIFRDVPREHVREDGSSTIDILCYNGWPMLLKANARSKAQMIASYDADKKVAAIVAATYGRGCVVGFSPHPEGATCTPGIFRDRDRHPLVYDGLAMGTARMLDNAIQWCASHAQKNSSKVK